MAVGADAIVRETHHAKSLFAPLMYLLGPQNWVSSFHAQDHSHGKLRAVFCLCPCLHMFGELTRAFQQTCLSTFFEDLVVSQVSLRHGVSCFAASIAPQRAARSLNASDHLDKSDGDSASAHFRQ